MTRKNLVVNTATNRLTSSDGCAMTYDAAGNQTYDCVGTHSYDAANRLTAAGAVGNTYGYDGDGRKVVQNTGGYGNSTIWSSVLGQPVVRLRPEVWSSLCLRAERTVALGC
ncbi:MAG: hypothetical protein IPL01_21795 [Acidobacteria bacterium]|nr:hypothetical protein [Acidobacteriota bacterium]